MKKAFKMLRKKGRKQLVTMLILLTCLQNFEAKGISQEGIMTASENKYVVALLKSKAFLDLRLPA